MKILYCITSASWGGAQLNVLELCHDQINRGNEVVFVVGNNGRLLDLVKKINDVKVIILPELHREINLISDIKAVTKLRKIIKQEKPDIVHLHSSKAGTIGRLAAIGLKSKVVFTVHGWAFTDGISSSKKKKLYCLIEKMVAPLTDLFICVSKFDMQIGIRDGVLKSENKNYVTIRNGSPVPEKVERALPKYPIRLVMTARFSKQKDQETLIKAVSKIDKDKYILNLVGDGETLEANKKLVQELSLSNNVFFRGFANDVSQSLIHNDIYILSTHYEGLPISIIEAMSYGLPIIATDVGGNGELVKGNGILINNESDLVNALNRLISNPKLIVNYGSKSRQIFEDEYTLKECMNNVNRQYLKLMRDEKY